MKKVYRTYNAPSNEPVCALLESQKENREKGKGAQSLFKEIMVESFPNPGRKMEIQIHVAQKNIKSDDSK